MPPKKGTKKAPAKAAAAKKTTAAEKKVAEPVATPAAKKEAEKPSVSQKQQEQSKDQNPPAKAQAVEKKVTNDSAAKAEASAPQATSQAKQLNPEQPTKPAEVSKVNIDQKVVSAVSTTEQATKDPTNATSNARQVTDAKGQAALEQAAAENGRVVEIQTKKDETDPQNIENRTIFLGSNTTAVQQSEPSAQAKTVSELTQQEKKALRKQRFGNGAPADGSTLDQAEKIKAAKEKIAQRAERFGIQTKEKFQEKIKGRQQRFGIETKESMNEKKKQRMERFGMMVNHADEIVGDAAEFEKKKKAREERFGSVDEQDKNQKSLLKKRRFHHSGNNRPKSNQHRKFQKPFHK